MKATWQVYRTIDGKWTVTYKTTNQEEVYKKLSDCFRYKYVYKCKTYITRIVEHKNPSDGVATITVCFGPDKKAVFTE